MAEYFANGHLRFMVGDWRDDKGNIVDIAKVVRCYQCKYYIKSMMLCQHDDGLHLPDKLDYCSLGERWKNDD